MQFFTNYFSVIIGLTLLNAQAGTGFPLDITALDTTGEVVELNANSFNITSVTHGTYSPGKRATTPFPCNFDPRLSYSYTKFTTEQVALPNEACFAWVPTASCSLAGGDNWTGDTTNDFQAVVSGLIVQDGWLSSSTVGAWSSTFKTGTTAFANRASATLFQWAFLSSNGAFGDIPSIFEGAGGEESTCSPSTSIKWMLNVAWVPGCRAVCKIISLEVAIDLQLWPVCSCRMRRACRFQNCRENVGCGDHC